jgi:hypothetical protein
MNRCFPKWLLFVVSPLAFAGCGEDPMVFDEPSSVESTEAITTCAVDWEKELLITDIRVVGDARARNNGPWSFGGIMKAMAGTRDEQQFVKGFVESWMQDQNVDGSVVKARPRMKEVVLDPWKARSAAGTYDLALAPFELLAIVYRVDLRRQNNVGDGAGEGRFVYGVRDGGGRMMPFTVIAEFGLPKYQGKSALDWANDWHSLGQLELGSLEYNQRLESITNQFASRTARAGAVPGTALNQLRTNEIALDFNTGHTPIWELREFHIESDGFLHPARPALTPMNEMNGSSTLSTYVNQNAKAIKEGTQKLPVKFRGTAFSAGSSAVPTNSFTWDVPGVSDDLARLFSMQTCNGCHAGSTGTNFLHIGPNFTGGPARLSDFVVSVEMPRRMTELRKVLGCE